MGNLEDKTRDGRGDGYKSDGNAKFCRWKGSKKVEKKISLCSLNSQGLEGAWRMLHLATSKNFEEVDVLMLQEVSANDTQWKGMQRYMRKCGYRGFYTPGSLEGSKKTALRHRGVATLPSSFEMAL